MRTKILCIVSFCVCITFGGCEELSDRFPGALTAEEIVAGLRAALNEGAKSASSLGFCNEQCGNELSADGFLKNKYIDISIPLPSELSPMLSAIDDVPEDVWALVKQLTPEYDFPTKFTELFRAMNVAAAIAARGAFNAFVPVILNLRIDDGLAILKSENNTAATEHLFSAADADLRETFKTVIDEVFDEKIDVMKEFWTPLATSYNKLQNTIKDPILRLGLVALLGQQNVNYLSFGGSAIETNLEPYIANLAIDGLKKLVAREETLIRANPLNYTDEIIRRVFGNKD